MVNTISRMMLFGTQAILGAAIDTDQRVWTPQRRRFLPMLTIWGQWLDLVSFVVGQIVGYLLWEWRDGALPRCGPGVFVIQALHFDIAVCLVSMILPGNILQKLSADHTSGALDQRTTSFLAMLASVALLSWMYYNAFHFISPNAVNQWQNASREDLSTWLVVTIATVVITLAMLKTPIVRQGLRYIVFEYMQYSRAFLTSVPYFVILLGSLGDPLAVPFSRFSMPLEALDRIRS